MLRKRKVDGPAAKSFSTGFRCADANLKREKYLGEERGFGKSIVSIKFGSWTEGPRLPWAKSAGPRIVADVGSAAEQGTYGVDSLKERERRQGALNTARPT